jgi:hypothetical protein
MKSLKKCKPCNEYKFIIRQISAENKHLKELNKYLEKEIQRLKTQNFYIENRKPYDLLHESNQKYLIEKIHYNLSKPLSKYLECYGLKLKLLTLKSKTDTHLIDFENDLNRRNVGDIEVKKFVSLENMNQSQEKILSQTLCDVQNENITSNAYKALSVNNICMNSLKQLDDMRKKIDSCIPIINICDEKNEINGSHLEINYAFEQCIRSLAKRKNKSLNDLIQPLYIKLSVDGTVIKNRYKYVAYSLCGFEYEDKNFANKSNHILLALISCDENYEILKYYFDNLHKELENKSNLKSIICENISIEYKFIICSDMKSLYTFMGLSGVCSKFNCIYCTIPKNNLSEVNNFFDNHLWKPKIEGGLGRVENDWNDIKRENVGIKNDMLIKISPDSIVVDTLHLRLRILEKFLSSVISSVINYDKNSNFIEIMNAELINKKITANIYSDIKSEYYIKYKINCLNLNVKIICTKAIIDFIEKNYEKFIATKLIKKIWDNWQLIFDTIESANNFDDSIRLENLIKDNYKQYNDIFRLNLIEFGNKRFTPYMHIVCHLPEIIRRYGKLSIFNTQGLK